MADVWVEWSPVRRCQAPRGTSNQLAIYKPPHRDYSSPYNLGQVGRSRSPKPAKTGVRLLWDLRGGSTIGLVRRTCHVRNGSSNLLDRSVRPRSGSDFGHPAGGTARQLNAVPGAKVRSSSPYKRVESQDSCGFESHRRPYMVAVAELVYAPTKAGPIFPRATATLKT